jgi:hypothetical protein
MLGELHYRQESFSSLAANVLQSTASSKSHAEEHSGVGNGIIILCNNRQHVLRTEIGSLDIDVFF